MLDVPSLRFRGFKHEICLSVSSLPGRGGERGGACHRHVLRAVAEENFVVKVSVQLLGGGTAGKWVQEEVVMGP